MIGFGNMVNLSWRKRILKRSKFFAIGADHDGVRMVLVQLIVILIVNLNHTKDLVIDEKIKLTIDSTLV